MNYLKNKDQFLPQQLELRVKASKVGPVHRDKWINNDRAKRNKLKCDNHNFCSLKYEFQQLENTTVDERVLKQFDQAQSLDNNKAPMRKKYRDSSVNLSTLTEEALDDWIFQSMNRPLQQFLDPHKKFDVPQQYLEEIKSRYSVLRSNKMQMEHKEYYHGDTGIRQQKYIIQDGKSVLNPLNLLFDHKKMDPKEISGQPIAGREEQKLKKWQNHDTRRKGIYLRLDDNHHKLMMEINHEKKGSVREIPQFMQLPKPEIDTSKHLFLQNYDNFTRNTNNKEDVQTSFADQELKDVEAKISKQLKIQSMADQDLATVKSFNTNTVISQQQNQQQITQQQLSIQHGMFKKHMELIVQDFKSFIKNEEEDNVPKRSNNNDMEQSLIQYVPQQSRKNTQNSRVYGFRGSQSYSRDSKRPSQLNKKAQMNKSMAAQMKDWYDMEKKDDKRKTTMHIREMIAKMNQDRSVELDSKLDSDHSNDIMLTLNKPKTTVDRQDVIKQLEGIIKPSSRLFTSSNRLTSTHFQLNNALKEKTVQLLNQNSEERIKYKMELVSFNAHLEENTQAIKKSELSNSEFWYNKGVLILKSNQQTALHCFRQCLIQDPLQLDAIQNIAIIYEKSGKFQTAKKWFQLALNFKPLNTYKFGYSLCLYKMGYFSQAYKLLDSIIEQDQNSVYIYLRGLCAKRMYDLEKAALSYKIVQQRTRATNYELLVHCMMAIVFSQKRQLEMKFDPLIFCQFHTLVTQVIEQELFIEVLTTFWNVQTKEWIKIEELLQKLKSISFFKRFARSVLQNFISVMKLKKVDCGHVIFPKEDEVHIIVAGNIMVLDHRNQFDRPEIIAFYKQGDILGCPDKDNQLCDISDIWFVTQTEIEYISIQKNYFEELWQAQIKLDGFELLTKLQTIKLFEGVSIMTLYKLVYELLRRKQCKINEVLFNDRSYQEKFEYINLRKYGKEQIVGKNRIHNYCTIGINKTNQKFKKLFMKNKLAIDKLKFNRQQIHGLYIILSGQGEIENPNGFNNYFLGPGDYFGESLMFEAKGFNAYGRVRVSQPNTEVLFFSRFDFNKIPTLDMKIMEQNCYNRDQIKLIDHIYKRRLEVMEIRKTKKNHSHFN